MHWRVQIDIAKVEKSRLFHTKLATKGNHRRYDIEDIRRAFYKHDTHEMRKKVVGYARVSGRDQADDLKRQELRLEKECCKHLDDFEIISDLGSGINYNKKGLKRLLSMILAGRRSTVALCEGGTNIRVDPDAPGQAAEVWQPTFI